MLFDGTKLLGGECFSEAKRHAGLNDEQMAQRFINVAPYLHFKLYKIVIGPYFQ